MKNIFELIKLFGFSGLNSRLDIIGIEIRTGADYNDLGAYKAELVGGCKPTQGRLPIRPVTWLPKRPHTVCDTPLNLGAPMSFEKNCEKFTQKVSKKLARISLPCNWSSRIVYNLYTISYTCIPVPVHISFRPAVVVWTDPAGLPVGGGAFPFQLRHHYRLRETEVQYTNSHRLKPKNTQKKFRKTSEF